MYNIEFYKYICTRFRFKFKIVNIVYNKINIAFYYKNCIIIYKLYYIISII